MTGVAFGSATVTLCMHSIAAFCLVIFTLIRLCCKCVCNVPRCTYRGIPCTSGRGGYIQRNSLLRIHTIYMHCSAYVNGFKDTSAMICLFNVCGQKKTGCLRIMIIQLCWNVWAMYPGIHTGEFPTVDVHTIYMHCSDYVNGFKYTNVYVYLMYMCMWPKNWLFEVLMLENSPAGIIYYSFIRFSHQKCLLHQAICSAWERNLEAFYTDPQYCYRYSLYWQCLVCTGCVFRETLAFDYAVCLCTCRGCIIYIPVSQDTRAGYRDICYTVTHWCLADTVVSTTESNVVDPAAVMKRNKVILLTRKIINCIKLAYIRPALPTTV